MLCCCQVVTRLSINRRVGLHLHTFPQPPSAQQCGGGAWTGRRGQWGGHGGTKSSRLTVSCLTLNHFHLNRVTVEPPSLPARRLRRCFLCAKLWLSVGEVPGLLTKLQPRAAVSDEWRYVHIESNGFKPQSTSNVFFFLNVVFETIFRVFQQLRINSVCCGTNRFNFTIYRRCSVTDPQPIFRCRTYSSDGVSEDRRNSLLAFQSLS